MKNFIVILMVNFIFDTLLSLMLSLLFIVSTDLVSCFIACLILEVGVCVLLCFYILLSHFFVYGLVHLCFLVS